MKLQITMASLIISNKSKVLGELYGKMERCMKDFIFKGKCMAMAECFMKMEKLISVNLKKI